MKRPSATTAKTANGTSDKHQRILDAAIEVIAEHGFFHSRVAEIADRAGVADGTIYLYFKNKDEFLMAAIDSAFHRFIRRAKAALTEIDDQREKLRRIAFLHLEGLGSNRSLAIVFQTELRHSAKFLGQFSHNLMVEYFDLIKGVLREGQSAGVFRADLSVTIAAHCFFGAVDEIVTSWILSDREHHLIQPGRFSGIDRAERRGSGLLSMEIRTLADIFFASVARDKNRHVMVKRGGGWLVLSSRQLYGYVAALSRIFKSWGINKGDRVAILSENRPEWMIVDFACVTSGIVDVRFTRRSPRSKLSMFCKIPALAWCACPRKSS